MPTAAKPKPEAEKPTREQRQARRERRPKPADADPSAGVVSLTEYQRVRDDLEEALGKLAESDGRIEELSSRIGELEPLEGQLKTSETARRSIEAARAYDKLADELGVKPEFRDDVWELAKFTPGDGDLDVKAMKEHLSKYLDGKKHFTASAGDKKPAKLPKDEFSGKGGSPGAAGAEGGKLQVTRAQYGDPDWRKANAAQIKNPEMFDLVDSIEA